MTEEECDCTEEELQLLKQPVLSSMEILEKAPQVWTGDEEEKLRAAQEAARAKTGAVRGHVMLSYNQQSCSEHVRRMHAKLKREGIPTWVDFENMRGGNLNENMANAVENAAIVVAFVHNLYKESGNCRREAEYSAKKNKRMLYAHCQPGYDADGWLGLLMGNSLWYGLEGDFEGQSNLLIKHIKQIYEEGKSINQVQASAKSSGQSGAGASAGAVGGPHLSSTGRQAKPAGCSGWNASQVSGWLKENEIDFLCEQCALHVVSLLAI